MQPITCIVHKAIETAGKITPNLCITASEEFPRFREIIESRTLFILEAEEIFKALSHTLPGGTLDHLLAIMLKEKSSHFAVLSWPKDKEK